MDKFTRIEGDYKAIVQNLNPLIPPIFGTDEFGWCSEWNQAMTELSGWSRGEVIDKMLLGEVFGTRKACCRLSNQEAFVNLSIVLNKAMTSQESEMISFGFFARIGKYVECMLSVTKKVDGEGTVTGLFCFLQLASKELQQALHFQKISEQIAAKRLKALSYVRRQIRNPLSGIIFSRKMMEGTDLGDEQRQLLHTSALCQRQLNKVLDDTDLDSIIDGHLDLEMTEFGLQQVLGASISQVMTKSNEMGIQIANNVAADVLSQKLYYGDSVRLQQVLADFLSVSVTFTPTGGLLSLAINLTSDPLAKSVQLVEVRITHSGGGVPDELIRQMFGSRSADATEEGISLLISRNLLRLMGGDVQYLREATNSTFSISVELASKSTNEL